MSWSILAVGIAPLTPALSWRGGSIPLLQCPVTGGSSYLMASGDWGWLNTALSFQLAWFLGTPVVVRVMDINTDPSSSRTTGPVTAVGSSSALISPRPWWHRTSRSVRPLWWHCPQIQTWCQVTHQTASICTALGENRSEDQLRLWLL